MLKNFEGNRRPIKREISQNNIKNCECHTHDDVDVVTMVGVPVAGGVTYPLVNNPYQLTETDVREIAGVVNSSIKNEFQEILEKTLAFDEIRSDISEINETISNLAKNEVVSGLLSDVDTIRNEISDVRTEIESLADSELVKGLESRLDDVEVSIKDIATNDSVENLSKKVDSMESDLNGKITELLSTTENLKVYVDQENLTQTEKIDLHNNRLLTIDGEINDIKNEISDVRIEIESLADSELVKGLESRLEVAESNIGLLEENLSKVSESVKNEISLLLEDLGSRSDYIEIELKDINDVLIAFNETF